MKKGTLLFFLKGIVLIALLVLVDQGSGRLLERYFTTSHTPEYARVSYAIDSTREDILIFGNSRANHHYIPDVITKGLNASCYNAGKDDHHILYAYAVLQALLRRYTPKLIILDLNPFEFEMNKSSDIVPLLPYYRRYPEMHSVVASAGTFEKYKAMSSLYCYNSLPLSIAVYNIAKNPEPDTMHGFIPLSGIWANPIKNDPFDHRVVDSVSLQTYRDFLALADKKGIRVMVLVSPRFMITKGTEPLSIARGVCERRKIPFYDFSADTAFTNHREYFKDEEHLNFRGAKIYSEMVGRLVLRQQLFKSL